MKRNHQFLQQVLKAKKSSAKGKNNTNFQLLETKSGTRTIELFSLNSLQHTTSPGIPKTTASYQHQVTTWMASPSSGWALRNSREARPPCPNEEARVLQVVV
jgi:ethanolamine utilization protein EutQ (cupin superfamily)